MSDSKTSRPIMVTLVNMRGGGAYSMKRGRMKFPKEPTTFMQSEVCFINLLRIKLKRYTLDILKILCV